MFGAPDWALDDEMVTMRPQLRGEHVGHRGLDAGERAGEVHRDDAVPVRRGDVEQRRERLDARAGDEELDRAELGADLAKAAATESRSATSTSTAIDLAAQLRGRRFGGRAVQVEEGDAVAVGRELLRDAEPDARRSAGDDRDAAHDLLLHGRELEVQAR